MKTYIESNAHVFVAGATGTGKTFLVEEYLRNYTNVIKLDTKLEYFERLEKNESPWRGLKMGEDFEVCQSLADCQASDFDKIIYAVPYEEQTIENLNDFFFWIFERKNTIVWIDELMSIATAHRYPSELGRLMIMGRSKGIGVWCCSQRPQGVPSIVIANCMYFFVFRLSRFNDRKAVVDNTGFPEMIEPPTGHEFWYAKMDDEHATLCKLST